MDISPEFKPLVDLLSGQFGWLPAVLAWIGALRVPMKIASSHVQRALTGFVASVAASPEQDDDDAVRRILGSLWYRFLAFALDAVLSFKLPTSDSLKKLEGARGAAPVGVISVLCLLSSILWLTGCIAPGQQANCAPAAGLAQRTVQRGLLIALSQEPQIRSELVLADAALAELIGANIDDPLRLETEIAQRAPGVNPLAMLAIGAALDGFRLYGQQRLQDQAARVACFQDTLGAIRAGLAAAIANKPASGLADPRVEKLLRDRGLFTPAPASVALDPIPAWKRLWLPVVPWEQCPVTPDKMYPLLSDLGRQMSAHNPITGRY